MRPRLPRRHPPAGAQGIVEGRPHHDRLRRVAYLKGKHNLQEPISEDDVMNILKFNNDKADYSSASLKPMLDFVLTTKLANDMDNQTYKVVKQQIELIKNSLDLSVHNLKYFTDIEGNKAAWTNLEPLFDYLSNNIHTEE